MKDPIEIISSAFNALIANEADSFAAPDVAYEMFTRMNQAQKIECMRRIRVYLRMEGLDAGAEVHAGGRKKRSDAGKPRGPRAAAEDKPSFGEQFEALARCSTCHQLATECRCAWAAEQAPEA